MGEIHAMSLCQGGWATWKSAESRKVSRWGLTWATTAESSSTSSPLMATSSGLWKGIIGCCSARNDAKVFQDRPALGTEAIDFLLQQGKLLLGFGHGLPFAVSHHFHPKGGQACLHAAR